MTTKTLGIMFCAIAFGLLIFSGCKSQRSCDAYSRHLIIKLDSLRAELQLSKDSLELKNEYISFLETDNQLLGSAMTSIDLKTYPKTHISRLKDYIINE